MNKLVEFTMIGNNVEINNNGEYLENKIKQLINEGIITNIKHHFDEFEVSEKICIENNFLWYVEFNMNDIDFQIIFSFETYNGTMQLCVTINSNMELDGVTKEKSELEILKVNLKNKLFNLNRKTKSRDWNKCIWLYDKESQIFSAQLYPKIYQTENLFRQFINDVMGKVFGADWWELLAPVKLKDKRKKRVNSYKSIVPSLSDVDESLLVIDVGDLLEIARLRIEKWKPIYDEKINRMINKLVPFNQNEMFNILRKQSTTEIDIWDKYFSKYLSSDFISNFQIFESNRNHIAHNKIIDRQAYKLILKYIDLVYNDIKNGLEKFCNEYVSEEKHELLEREKQYEKYEEESFIEELMESEAGIQIRQDDEIYELFEEALIEFHQDIVEALRFRNDIEISEFNGLVFKPVEQTLFEIKYKINDMIAYVCCSMDIYDSQGATSQMELILKCNGDLQTFLVPYINGQAVYNDEQCNYMPETEDEFGYKALEYAKDSMIDYINETFENLREKIDDEMYKINKEGSISSVADILCCECGEKYICINENFAEYGKCLNCGEMNEIYLCERCGNYFEDYDDDYEDDVPRLCRNCKEHYLNQ
ncbi:hypothetical protein [Clostridium botulinum]|uniref:hypothetical protein n=1 Tax=Clostridium botulinum TaxID=1491 RepID=UPI0004D42AD4|nr:hypothetical protein [Clostridium botulinum]KEI03002.1 hypothetical protein Z952_08895 [Clostridium botulinum C/D str. BKT75002]KEI07386.1 hypothetical protein Z954_04415 [Clostridium botulinum C/D str. BKT2873]QPW59764.1 hypothetical protein IG390_08425 [Clostridium botulinum]QPW62289.1 hypothetical protein IG390_15050 [Clostridium phage CWou-2020b]